MKRLKSVPKYILWLSLHLVPSQPVFNECICRLNNSDGSSFASGVFCHSESLRWFVRKRQVRIRYSKETCIYKQLLCLILASSKNISDTFNTEYGCFHFPTGLSNDHGPSPISSTSFNERSSTFIGSHLTFLCDSRVPPAPPGALLWSFPFVVCRLRRCTLCLRVLCFRFFVHEDNSSRYVETLILLPLVPSLSNRSTCVKNFGDAHAT